MIQATIWSGRQHCEDAVARGLKFLAAPADGRIDRLWLVHSLEQQQRLDGRVNNVRWTKTVGPVVPQYAPEDAKKLACLRGFDALLTALYATAGDDDVLLVEDDIEVAPDTLLRMKRTMAATGASAVSALTRSSVGLWPVFRYQSGERVGLPPGEPLRRRPGGYMHRLTDAELLPEPRDVDAVGTFCLLLAGALVDSMARENYRPEIVAPEYTMVGHDAHFCCWLRERGHRLILDSAIRVNHHCEIAPGQVLVRREMR